jgi:hypothetical protein
VCRARGAITAVTPILLVGLGGVGTRPVWASLDEARAWFQAPPAFAGDDFELAHRLLMRPDEVLADGTPQTHAESYDVLVGGGGVAGTIGRA